MFLLKAGKFINCDAYYSYTIKVILKLILRAAWYVLSDELDIDGFKRQTSSPFCRGVHQGKVGDRGTKDSVLINGFWTIYPHVEVPSAYHVPY